MTQRRSREFSTVTINDRSMTDWSSIITVLNSRNVMTDHICSHFNIRASMALYNLMSYLIPFYDIPLLLVHTFVLYLLFGCLIPNKNLLLLVRKDA